MKPLLLLKDILTLNTKELNRRWIKLNRILYRNLFPKVRTRLGINKNIKKIPIIINNRNRLSYLTALISWLEKKGYHNIYIIDNNSSYPPLLNYYHSTKYKVFRLKDNVGHLALWKTGIYNRFKRNYYAYTDPDILPIQECPDDFMEFFMKKLDQYKSIEKIGFGLKLDDIPEHYVDKHKVIEWEKKFWVNEVEPGIFDADIDTTFALYRPLTNNHLTPLKAYRTVGKYLARHLPWYENTAQPLEENEYYKRHVRPGASHWIAPDSK
jgi:hypothetical protein